MGDSTWKKMLNFYLPSAHEASKCWEMNEVFLFCSYFVFITSDTNTVNKAVIVRSSLKVLDLVMSQ
jgi:hypothetical protein